MAYKYEVGHYDTWSPHIGDIVYPHYEVQNVGKVTKVVETDRNVKPGTYYDLTIRMTGGREFIKSNLHVKCFRCQVAGHERKAKNQGAKLKEAEAV